MIIDGHPVHRTVRAKAFVEASNDTLMLFHLPEYPPELNPNEQFWNLF